MELVSRDEGWREQQIVSDMLDGCGPIRSNYNRNMRPRSLEARRRAESED